MRRDYIIMLVLCTIQYSYGQSIKLKEKIPMMISKISYDESLSVLSAYKEAYILCRNNFQMARWNCPIPRLIKKTQIPISMTTVYPMASKETAYVYSLVAASIVYHLIRSCQMGKGGTKCPCSEKDDFTNAVLPCQKNLKHGFKRGRAIIRYLDYKHIENGKRKEFNWRNSMTGFQALKKDLKLVCRCHGVSGHCTTKKCWKTTPVSLSVISLKLKKMYKVAKKLQRNISPTPIEYIQSVTRTTMQKVDQNNSILVFLDDSPNYCIKNSTLGIAGTLNRECDHDDNDKSCDTLCSSCGYRKHSFVRKINNAKCNCKFYWCCKVTCDSCVEHRIYARCAKPS